jgi:hypothetical protein
MAGDGVQGFAVLAVVVAAAGTLLVLTGFAGAESRATEPTPATFRLEDGSAACALLGSGEVACRARGGDAAAVLERDGGSHPSELELFWDESTPVLLAAESWWADDVRCSVVEGALTCSRRGGSIFVDTGGTAGVL